MGAIEWACHIRVSLMRIVLTTRRAFAALACLFAVSCASASSTAKNSPPACLLDRENAALQISHEDARSLPRGIASTAAVEFIGWSRATGLCAPRVNSFVNGLILVDDRAYAIEPEGAFTPRSFGPPSWLHRSPLPNPLPNERGRLLFAKSVYSRSPNPGDTAYLTVWRNRGEWQVRAVEHIGGVYQPSRLLVTSRAEIRGVAFAPHIDTPVGVVGLVIADGEDALLLRFGWQYAEFRMPQWLEDELKKSKP